MFKIKRTSKNVLHVEAKPLDHYRTSGIILPEKLSSPVMIGKVITPATTDDPQINELCIPNTLILFPIISRNNDPMAYELLGRQLGERSEYLVWIGAILCTYEPDDTDPLF